MIFWVTNSRGVAVFIQSKRWNHPAKISSCLLIRMYSSPTNTEGVCMSNVLSKIITFHYRLYMIFDFMNDSTHQNISIGTLSLITIDATFFRLSLSTSTVYQINKLTSFSTLYVTSWLVEISRCVFRQENIQFVLFWPKHLRCGFIILRYVSKLSCFITQLTMLNFSNLMSAFICPRNIPLSKSIDFRCTSLCMSIILDHLSDSLFTSEFLCCQPSIDFGLMLLLEINTNLSPKCRRNFSLPPGSLHFRSRTVSGA